eukprot:15438777-Alexandrium_andersonii.AAC.1
MSTRPQAGSAIQGVGEHRAVAVRPPRSERAEPSSPRAPGYHSPRPVPRSLVASLRSQGLASAGGVGPHC